MDADGFISGLHADIVEELISDDNTADSRTDDSSEENIRLPHHWKILMQKLKNNRRCKTSG